MGALLNELRGFGSCLIAYSGGIDSTLLMWAGQEALGEKARAVLADSPSLPAREREAALATAAHLGTHLEILRTGETDDADYQRNDGRRCYFCKAHVYRALRARADELGIPHVLDGMNVNDTADIRPGRTAAKELGIRSPLFEHGFTKEDIRQSARALGLPNWDKPAAACLASRVPYGTRVTPALLGRIEAAEQLVRDLTSLEEFRVRHHGEVVRLEVLAAEIAGLLVHREKLSEGLKKLGWLYVTVDLAGFQSGSLNAMLRFQAD